jgi:UDP-GlcNAc:undecaprenyl-phosphate GlcNAc-1-phosphate transferase
MGDAGALFLGFMLAYLGMKLRFDAPTSTTFLVPILVMGVPIFDTTLVTVTRLRRGVSPFVGGRDHTSHRIVRTGLPVPAAVVLIYTIGICLGMVAFVVSRIDRTSAYVLTAAVLILAALSGVLLSLVAPDDSGGEPIR